MALVNAFNLTMSFSDKDIFSDVSFEIAAKDKIGLIGVNGAGKTTLFKIFTGEYQPTDGNLFIGKDTIIGYMEQHACAQSERTMHDELLTVFDDVIKAEIELEKIARQIDSGSGDTEKLISHQQQLLDLFEKRGGLTYKSRARSALLGLGFNEKDFSLPCSILSGGQRSKVSLAKLLLSGANLLLLDEPTNHLDIDSVEWLEDFLSNYKGAFIVISHDRYFLDKVTEKTFELENGNFRSYDGSYTEYMAQREIERITKERNYTYTMREIHRLEEVVEQQRRWKHKKNKKTHTLDNTRKAIERLEKTIVEPDKAPDSMHFHFKACEGGAQRVAETKDLGMAFGDNRLFDNVDMLIKKGEKVFLLGPNGCGKTSLIKILMGIYRQTEGRYKIGDNIRIGYYDQLKENLHKDKTVIDEVWDEYPYLTQTEIRSALALFLFKGEDVFKEIKSLSGGELARVELTKLLLKKVNFLIMDEPTNHLDIASCEALESALADYDGTLLMVSHDRYFINRLATRVIRLHTGGIDSYDGNYDYYAEHCIERNVVEVPKKVVKENAYKKQKELESLKRRTQGKISRLEQAIDDVDTELADVQAQINDPDNAADYEKILELTNRLHELTNKQEEMLEEWQALNEELESLDL